MNTIVTRPYSGWRLLGEVENYFSDVFSPANSSKQTASYLTPAMDIVETKAAYQLKANLPGVEKEHIVVSVKDNILSIEANAKKQKADNENEKVIKSERFSGTYKRTLILNNTVNDRNIKADYNDGVLFITLPKSTETKDRVIPINPQH